MTKKCRSELEELRLKLRRKQILHFVQDDKMDVILRLKGEESAVGAGAKADPSLYSG
jgi:hypothetical protein